MDPEVKLNDVDLKNLFAGLQSEMRAKLLGVANVPHPVIKGDETEASWLKMLQDYLPKRYQAERAMVVDHQGKCSQQIDIVIFDRHFSPFILHYHTALMVPAEAVYAVLEVKPNMSADHIRYAGEKVASVRSLARTSARIVDRGEAKPPRDPPYILGGLLCRTSDWKSPMGDSFKDALEALPAARRLDVGCCLDAGIFDDRRHLSKEPPEFKILRSPSHSLVLFLLTLLQRLQSLGTVPAIEFDRYRAAIEAVPGAEG